MFVVTALSRRETMVAVPGISQPVKIRPRTSDKYCFEQIFLEDCYDLGLPQDPRFIVDGGANVGYASIFFANRYPNASIVAVEPDPSNFSALLANIQTYPQIKAIQGAIWHKAQPVVVDSSDDSWAAFVTDPDSAPEHNSSAATAQGLTVAELLQISAEGEIDILKLDIEGTEKQIFSAPDCSWLDKTKLLIIELHDRMVPGCSEALDKAVRAYSFRREVRGENTILINGKSATCAPA